jgi:tetratricopeptide (TPR) repeat protein
MNLHRLLKLIVLFIFSTLNLFAQNKSDTLNLIWENTLNPDSVRFKALADYYILNNQVQPEASLNMLEYYYQLARKKNNIKELYNVANDRGGIYRLLNQLDTSMFYYKEAEQLAAQLNEPALKAVIIGNIGNIYANKNDYKTALTYFSDAYKLFKSINDKRGTSRMLTGIGSVYLYIQNYELAIQYYQQALKTEEGNKNNERNLGVIYLNIGWTNYELKRYKEAIPFYKKAIKNLQINNDKFFLSSGYSTIAKIYLELNQLSKAAEYADRNMTLCNELHLPDYISDGQIILAQIEFKKGNIGTAKQKAEAVLQALDKNASKEIKTDLYDLLYRIYQAEKNPQKSLEMFQKYSVYKDSIQLERNKLTLVRDVIKNEFDDLLIKSEEEKVALEGKQQKKIIVMLLFSIIAIACTAFYYKGTIKKDRKKRDKLLQEIENLKRNHFNNTTINSPNVAVQQMAVNPNKWIEKEEIKHQADDANNSNINKDKEKQNTIDVTEQELYKQTEKIEAIDVNELAINTNEFELIREKIERTIDRKLNATDWNVLNILLKEPEVSNKDIAEKAFMSVDGIGSSLRRMYLYFDIKETKYKKIALIMEAIKASKV